MDVPPTRRIVLLGKTGAGKSSLANTLLGENMFQMSHSPLSQTSICQAETKLINGRLITLIDTPGFFDTGRSEDDMKLNILQCIVECAPGPHAFVLVLKVEKFTAHEKAVIENMFQYFSEEVLRYAAILFTYGDQLPEGMKIQEFVSQSDYLTDLVKKCGGRCHVVDNRYWNNEPQNEYRSNKVQMEDLLNTIDNLVMENKGGYYTNELLQAMETEIQKEEVHIRQASGTVSQKETRAKAKSAVYKQNVARFAHIAGKGLLIAAMFGQPEFGVLALAVKGVRAVGKAVMKKRPATDASLKGETAPGETEGTAKGRASAQATSKQNEGASATGTITKAKTGADFFSTFVKIFKKSNAGTNESAEDEANTAETDETAIMEEVLEDKTEELDEGASTEATGTTEVIPTTETDQAAVEEEENEELERGITHEVTITAEAASEVTVTGDEAAAEGAAATTVEDVGRGILAEGEGAGAATLRNAMKEETDGVVLSAAEGAVDVVEGGVTEAALSAAGGTASLTTVVQEVAESSFAGADVAASEGAAEVFTEAIEGVAEVMDAVAKVAESCCIQ